MCFRRVFSVNEKKINIYKENWLIIFTSLPIDKTCCLGLIERKPETDSSQYTNLMNFLNFDLQNIKTNYDVCNKFKS